MKRHSAPQRTKTRQTAAPAPAASQKRSTFGPAAHNAWALDAGQVSLVRKTLAPQPVQFDAKPQPLEIDLARSAVIVVDMQNDFCHPQGWFGQRGLSVRPTRKPIPVLQRLLPAWRAAGGAVVWLNWGIRADRLNLSPTVQFKGKRSAEGVGYAEHSAIDRGAALVQGEWGAQVVDELQVAPTDIRVNKHRLSGFWDNELDTVLRQQGIGTLLFAGVNTDRCVFSTLQDAGFLGYDCVLLGDACSTASPAYVSKAIHYIVQQLHGFVGSTESLLEALAALAAQAAPKRRAPRSTSTSPSASTTHPGNRP